MRKLALFLVLMLGTPLFAVAQVNTHAGGTGLVDVSTGSIPFGSIFNIRLATSSDLQFTTSASRLTFKYGSSTAAFSVPTLCLTGDVCRTTWPASSASIGTVSTSSQETAGQLGAWGTTNGYPAKLYSVATSSGTVSSPLTGSFICVGSGCTLGIQASSASQAGSMSAGDWQLLHTATTTFTTPLIFTPGTNAVTCQVATGSVPGCLAAADFTTFAAKISSVTINTTGILTGGGTGSSFTLNASSSPTVGYIQATSSLATSTFVGAVLIGAGLTAPSLGGYTHPYLRIGTTTCPINPVFYNFLDICGNEDTTNGVQAGIINASAGSKAYTGWTMGNDRADTNLTNFAGIYLNSSQYSDTTFGTGVNSKSQMLLQNTLGQLSFVTSTTSASSGFFNWLTLGSNVANEVARLTSGGNFGLSTTTPAARLGVQGNMFIAGNVVSTSTLASIFPYASSTMMSMTTSSSTNAFVSNQLSMLYASSSAQSMNWASSTFAWFQRVGIGSSTPTNMLSVGATTTYGSIAVAENVPATTTAIIIDWTKGNQQVIQIGGSATTISFRNSSTTGQTLRAVICNAGYVAGAVTFIIPSILWPAGTVPTQTTTANKCDVWSFIVTQATSTNASPAPVIFGAQTANF